MTDEERNAGRGRISAPAAKAARVLDRMKEFLQLEATGGILLMIAAAAALILANSPLGDFYVAFQEIPGVVQVGPLELSKPLLLWVNDLWMAVFFFLIGLEIKREFLEGQLSTPSEIFLPALAAFGGMVIPSGIYAFMNWGNPETLGGWAIPAATDIAFALGILALLGTRAPLSLKVLLTAIAIIDDLGAIVIIAAFYTDELSLTSLYLAGAAVLVLAALNFMGVARVMAYVLVGAVLWVCVLKSGVHATLAGVVTALFIPLTVRDEDGHSLLHHLEHLLHPWVAFLILPAGLLRRGLVQGTGERRRLPVVRGPFAARPVSRVPIRCRRSRLRIGVRCLREPSAPTPILRRAEIRKLPRRQLRHGY